MTNSSMLNIFSSRSARQKSEELLGAATNGDLRRVRQLLDRGVDVNTMDSNNNTILLLASWKGHTNIVELLLARGANANFADNKGITPLHMASKNGYTNIVSRLLDSGAVTNAKCNNSRTALHYTLKEPAIARMLLEKDVNIQNERDNEGNTALHILCFYNGDADVATVLLEYGVDVHAENKDAITAIHLSYKNPVLAKLLLERGAKVNQRNKYDNTALHTLCLNNGNPDVALLLLEYGVDISARNKEGKTAVECTNSKDILDLLVIRPAVTTNTRELFYNIFSIPKYFYILEQYHLKKLSRSHAINQIVELLNKETALRMMNCLYKINFEDFKYDGEIQPMGYYLDKKNYETTVIERSKKSTGYELFNYLKPKSMSAISIEDLKIVTEALKISTTVSKIDLKNFEPFPNLQTPTMGIKYFEILGEAVKSNANITSLDLEYSFLFHSDTDDNSNSNEERNEKLKSVMYLLNENKSITELHLGNNSIGDEGIKILAPALVENNTLKCLDLSRNNIGNAGATEVASLLGNNSTLMILSLEQNRIGTEGAVKIAWALRSNRALTKLILDYNEIIGTKAAKAFESLLGTNYSLCELELSRGYVDLKDVDLKLIKLYLELNKAGRSIMVEETVTSHLDQIKTLIKAHDELNMFFSLLLLRPELCSCARNTSSTPLVPNANDSIKYVPRSKFKNASTTLPSEFQQTFNAVDGIIEIKDEDIGYDSFQLLKKKIEDNQDIRGVRLVGVHFDDLKALQELPEITQHTELHLESFSVDRASRAEEVAKTMANMLGCKTILKYLDFSDANIGDVGCAALAEALKGNKTLRYLSVFNCNIKNEGCKAIANALGHYNDSLIYLDIGDNPLTKDSYIALARAIRFNTGLKILMLKNQKYQGVCATFSSEILDAFEEALHFNFVVTEIEFSGLTMDESRQLHLIKVWGPIFKRHQYSYDDQCDNYRGTLILDERQLGEHKFSRYISTLRGKRLHHLSLRNCSVGQAGCEAIAKNILLEGDTATHIKELNLENNEVGEYGCRQICRALGKNKTLTDLNLNSNGIGGGAVGCSEIMNALTTNNKTLQNISLQSNNIDDQDCTKLAPFLCVNTALKHLDLMSNKISASGCEELAKAFKKNNGTSLCYLNLGKNNICHDGCVALCDALTENATIQDLSLESNDIGDDSCEAISDMLSNNQCLQRLNLSSNCIADDGCIRICEGLDSNTDLEILDLRWNKIGENGCERLLELAESDSHLATELFGNPGIPEGLLTQFQETVGRRNN